MKKNIIALIIFCFTLVENSMAQSGGGELIPDVSRFKPIDMTDMVDLYSGDFSYSIPVMMIPSKNGSFPLTLSYSSGAVVNEEASAVGLGWALTPGAITRSVRAIPDDFESARYYYKYDYPDEFMYGLRVGAFTHNGHYNTGTNKYDYSLGVGLNDAASFGISGDSKGNFGGNVGFGPLSLGVSKEELAASMSVAGMDATISSDGSASVGGGVIAAAQDPGQFIGDQGIAMAMILLQQGISSVITDGAASWYIWYSDNKETYENNCYGSLKQNMNTSWLNGDYKHADLYDKVGFRWSTGHVSSSGMASDAYSVFAQGLQGGLMLINEPYQNGCTFRFMGDVGADYDSKMDDSRLNTRYYSSKKVDFYENPKLSNKTGKIVSFVITKEDGVRYVFGQPVYVQYLKKVGHSVPILAEDYAKKDNAIMTNYYKGEEFVRDGYAIAWLLTAILYPDYKPSTSASNAETATSEGNVSTANGVREDLIPDDNSKGNWVKYTYGSKDVFYLTSQQYLNANITGNEDFNGEAIGADGKSMTKNLIAKHLMYLRAVETNSHIAILNYSDDRTDGYESYSTDITAVWGQPDGGSKFARLEEIVLLSKKDVAKPTGTTIYWNDNYKYDINKALSGWIFKYSQELCKGIPNSDNNGDGQVTSADANATNKLGKLTLKEAMQYGRGRTSFLPPYKFEYNNTGTWGKWKYDRWGFYKVNGTKENHLTDFGQTADENAKQFCLKSIELPTGGKIDVDYESKKYLCVGRYDLTKYVGQPPEKHSNVVIDDIRWDGEVCGGWCNPITFKTKTVYLNEFVKSPNDKIEVVVRMAVGSEVPDDTRWRVRYNVGDGYKNMTMSDELSLKVGRVTFKATEYSKIDVQGFVENTYWNPTWKFDVWNTVFRVDIIVHHPEAGDIDLGGISDANPKSGGGPRVKKITYYNMLGDKLEKEYYYENWENSNRSSGVASIEPPTFTKDKNDVVEFFSDLRNFYKSGPFIGHSHVTVKDASGQKQYKFHTPYKGESGADIDRSYISLVLAKDIPSQHKFYSNDYLDNVGIFNLLGQKLGTMDIYSKTIPYVLVDKSALMGKPISEELVSKSGKVVSSTKYNYKDGFDVPIASDRNKFTRQVLAKSATAPESKENYFVYSVGPIHAIKDGTAFATNSTKSTSDLPNYLEFYQMYVNDVNLTNGYLISGEYVVKLTNQYASNYLFKYDVQPFVEKVVYEKDGVAKIVENSLWDAKNPIILRKTTKTASLGYDIVDEEIPAYHKYDGMESKNMLVQIYQSTKYKNAALAENAVKSQISTWKDFSDALWLKEKIYNWNTGINSSNVAEKSLSQFPFSSMSSIPNEWKIQTTFDRYDDYSHEIQISDPLGTKFSSIYGFCNALLIGKADNSDFRACGLYTCNYDNDQEGFFDKFNGWEKGGAQVVEVSSESNLNKHFAAKCLKVSNAFGATRNTKVINEKDYIFSAWVNVKSGTLLMSSEFRTYSGDDVIYPLDGSKLSAPQAQTPPPKQIGITNGWQFVESAIPASQLTGNNWYIRAWIGNQNGVLAYIDDIRIYPKDALVKTFYYDDLGAKLTVLVDENNKAKYFDYDGLARLTAIENNNGQLVSSAEYHMMGDPEEVYVNSFGLDEARFEKLNSAECNGCVFTNGITVGIVGPCTKIELLSSGTTNRAKLDIPGGAVFATKRALIKGYVRIPLGNYLILSFFGYAGTSSTGAAINKRIDGTGEWQQFAYIADITDYAAPDRVEFVVGNPGGSITLHMDELSVSKW